MLKKLNLSVFVILSFGFSIFHSNNVSAQESSATPTNPGSSVKKFPIAKQQSEQATSEAEESPSGAAKNEALKDGAEQIRKRAEWFYKQRASANGHIPTGARINALRHMQNMMVAEGKLKRRADGTFAAADSVQSAATAFPAWNPLGPAPTTGGEFSPVSGRVTTIAIDPSDASGNTVLIGGAQGGIWRTTDGGATWTVLGDENASLSMGSIEFAPSNSSIVYAGTGEQEGIGFDIYYGAGVLKSSDHGQTWTQTCSVPSSTCPFIGPYDDITPFGDFTLGGTRISYVAVNPSNPQMVLVGAQEFVEGTHEGVYCSDNGGTTWTNILPDEMSTFVGFASPTVAYAALGNPYGSSSGAPNGNGIYKATAIGSTCSTIHFARLTTGTLPAQSSMGRIDLGIAASDTSGNTVYASIADASSASNTNLGVYFSSNGGSTWTKTGAPDVCASQCWYDNVVKVDPQHAGTVFLGGSAVTDSSGNPQWVARSTNSGTSWSSVIPNLAAGSAGVPHVDSHAMSFVKLATGKVRMYLGNDGGIWRTDDAEAASIQWTNLNNAPLALTQFYPAISIPVSTPAFSIAGSQDNGTQEYSGTANWTDTGVCGDGTGTAIDALVPSSVYIACNGDFIAASYQNGASGTFAPAVNGINSSDFSNFVPPLVADPSNANTLYLGTTKIYQSTDGANSWTPISDDLVSGGNFDSLTAIAVAPGAPQNVYAGASNGAIFVANNVSPGVLVNFYSINNSSLLPPRSVSAIAADPADSSGKTAYVAFSGFSFVSSALGVNDTSGHIFKTTDGGNSWIDVSCSVATTSNCSKPAATDLPNIPVNDIVVDPDVPGALYAATDLGVFIGNCSVTPCTWTTLSSGLPRVAVLSLKMHEPSRTLRAATHGRGAWDLALNNFSFSGPHLSSINAPTPASANSGGAQFTLTVHGSGLTGGVIQFGGTALTATGTSSDTALSGIVPTSLLTTGTPQVRVKVGSTISNALPFPILGGTPTITSVTPSSTPVQTSPATNVTVQLTGTNFTSSAKVLFNGAQNGITVAAATSGCPLPTCLNATLPAGLLGPYGSTNDISVLVPPPGGGQSGAKTFKVVAPAPANDNIANATNITLLNTAEYADSSAATTESTDPVPPCVSQFSSANGNTGGHANGDYNTIWYKFTPQFSANLYLDMSASSYDTVLSIWSGTPGSLVNVACNDDITPGVVIQSNLSNTALTAGTTYYIMVGSFGPPDPNPVALGGRSILQFLYNGGVTPVPTLTSISPNTANSGDPGATLTVNGTGFLNGAIVYFQDTLGDLIAENTTFVSSTKLTATIRAADIALPATYNILVQNAQPTYGYSNPETLTVNVGTYPVPILTSIYPTSVVAGSLPFALSASGNNFATTAVLKFNGVAKQMSYGSPIVLGTTISTADIATPGTIQVTVTNPTPGGGTSAPQPFNITAPTFVPTIATVSPNSATANSFQSLTVTGTNFLAGASVYFAGNYWNTSVSSATQLTAQVSVPMTPGTYQVYVVDPSPAGTSAPVNFTATGPPDFAITSVGTTSVTVPAGTTATFTNAISVAAQNGFSAAVALMCSMPTNATATSCSVSPNSFPSGSGTASVMVKTTMRGMVPPLARYRMPDAKPIVLAAMLWMLMLVALRMGRTRRQRLAVSLPMLAMLLFVAIEIVGCGGGGGSITPPPPPPPTGTPVGTYSVTVNATSGNLSHSTTLTIVVQ